jgi:ABC-type phosphate/phosphonate transport system permease subunit
VAVKHELSAVLTHGGRVVRLAVPVRELARYPVITTQVPVTQSHTLVLIDGRRRASTVVGFAGWFEIVQRIDDALAVK